MEINSWRGAVFKCFTQIFIWLVLLTGLINTNCLFEFQGDAGEIVVLEPRSPVGCAIHGTGTLYSSAKNSKYFEIRQPPVFA